MTAPEPLGQDPEAGAAEDLAGVVADLLEVGGSLDEDVGHREGGVERESGVVAAAADLLGPDRRGMSTRMPQPSPSPSTLPAR